MGLIGIWNSILKSFLQGCSKYIFILFFNVCLIVISVNHCLDDYHSLEKLRSSINSWDNDCCGFIKKSFWLIYSSARGRLWRSIQLIAFKKLEDGNYYKHEKMMVICSLCGTLHQLRYVKFKLGTSTSTNSRFSAYTLAMSEGAMGVNSTKFHCSFARMGFCFSTWHLESALITSLCLFIT